jgi:hypothetical protein
MDNFEERALKQATQKPLYWFHYVDDTFVILPHGTEKLERFLDCLNGLHRNIQFTMEMEKDGHLPFLDIDVYKRPEGSLGHKVYRKPTRTNLYLNPGSQYHPCNKQAILATLVHRARALCDKDSLHGELEFLKTTSKENGYSCKQIQRVLNPKVRTSKPKDKPTPVTLLPYVQTTSCCLRMLARHNIKNVGLPPRKISQLPPSFEG